MCAWSLHIGASDQSLSDVKMTEMANQIKVGGVYHSQMHSISSDANYLNFFLKYGHFFERERERKSEKERKRERERERERERCENWKRPSLSTNNEAEKYKVAIQYRLIKVVWQYWQEVYELLNVISDLCVQVVYVN